MINGQTNNTGELITRKRNMKNVNVIHLKYIDDLTMAEAINLPKKLSFVPENVRPMPDTYHARTGHVLPLEKSHVYAELIQTKKYAEENDMQINYKKTKVMLFNPCTSVDFMPSLELGDHELEVVGFLV